MTGTDAAAPLRWALVGYGSGGRVFHAPLIASAPGLDLAAVVTRSPERTSQVAAHLPGVPTVPGLGSLAALGVRGVTISTPPATHAPLAREALAAGLHVVLDKPFALTAAEARATIAVARCHRRAVIPYVNRRWDGDFLTVRRLVAAGRLGTVHRFTSRLDRTRAVKPGWPSDAAAGGGTLADLGPHLIDQALVLLGPVVAVYAELDARRPGAAAEDDVLLQLAHASGARSTLAAGLASPATGPRFLVQGSRAGLRIEGFDVQEAQLKAGSSPAVLGDGWGEDPDRVALLTAPDGVTETIPLDCGRWDVIYPAVAEAIRSGGAAPIEPADAVTVAAVIDAARESAATGRRVAVPDGRAG